MPKPRDPATRNPPRRRAARRTTELTPPPSPPAHQGRWKRQPPPPKPASSRHYEAWSEADERTLEKYYTSHGGHYTAALLGRSVNATRARAGKLGIPGYETQVWSEEEAARARRKLARAKFGTQPVEAIAEELGRTAASCCVGRLPSPRGGPPPM